VFKTSVMMAQ